MKKIVCLIVTLLLLQINVYAVGEVTLTLDCGKTNFQKGETVSCNLNASVLSTENVNNVSLDIEKDADLTIEYIEGQNWSGSLSSGHLVLTSSALKTGNFRIGVLKITVDSNAGAGDKDVSFSNITFSNTQNTSGVYSVSNFKKTISVLDTDNTLKSLMVNGESVPNFEPDVLSYNNIEVTASKITIKAEANSSKTTITGTGEKELAYGKNTFEIKVKSEVGTEKIYTLIVNRPDNRSTVNTLSSLTIEGLNFNFLSTTTEYKINVESDVEKIKITSKLSDSKSSYVKDFGNREVALKYGENTVLVKVQSEKGEVKTYTLSINRNDDRSDEAQLLSLNINGVSVELKENVYEYEVTLLFKHNKTQITANANSLAKLEYKDMDLQVGDNELIIKVISEKETTKEYKIKIKRLTQEESRISIENIVVKNYQLHFTKDVTTYNLEVDKNVNSLEISVLPNEEEITFTVLGNSNLKNGSVVTINVKDDFGQYVYTINIIKAENDNLILGFLTLEQICYIVFIIGVLLFLTSIIYALKSKKVK